VPKVTEEHLEARRRQIVQAALTCFGRQGFHGTSMQDICREADLSPGAVYRYFDGKEAIIEAVCQEGVQQDMEMFATVQAVGALGALVDVVRTGLTEASDPDHGVDARVKLELWAASLRSERVRTLVTSVGDRYRAVIAEIIRTGQERGEMDPALDPDATARVLIGMYQGLVRERGLRADADISSYAEAAAALMRKGLGREAVVDVDVEEANA
jgi:AcrR family transcriptional regulator